MSPGSTNPPRTFTQEEASPGDSWIFTKPLRDESRRAAITGGTDAFAGATGALRAGGEPGQGYEIKLFLP